MTNPNPTREALAQIVRDGFLKRQTWEETADAVLTWLALPLNTLPSAEGGEAAAQDKADTRRMHRLDARMNKVINHAREIVAIGLGSRDEDQGSAAEREPAPDPLFMRFDTDGSIARDEAAQRARTPIHPDGMMPMFMQESRIKMLIESALSANMTLWSSNRLKEALEILHLLSPCAAASWGAQEELYDQPPAPTYFDNGSGVRGERYPGQVEPPTPSTPDDFGVVREALDTLHIHAGKAAVVALSRLQARAVKREEALRTTRQLVGDAAASGFTDRDILWRLFENQRLLTAALETKADD